MPIVKLTQSFINNDLHVPEGKARTEMCCFDQPGLYVEVRSTSQGQGTFYWRYKDSTGKTCHQKIGRTSDITLADARKQAKTLKAEIELGADPRGEHKRQKAVLTLDELWSLHYKPYAQPRKRSFDRDEQLWRIRIKGKFGHMRLNQITRQQIQSFHTELLAEGLSPASCDLHLKLCRYMYNCSKNWELYDGPNPVSRVPLFNADNKVQNILSEVELERLMAVLQADSNKTVSLIIQWLFATGMRLGATLAARWENLDKERCILVIPSSIAKSKKCSSIPLNNTAIAILDQLDTEGKFESLFINKKTGKPFTTITKVWDRLRKQAGLPHFRLHDGRHTFASILINNNISIYTISKLLTHSDVKVTSRYAHLSSKTLQDASNSASLTIQDAMQGRRATPAAQVVSLPGDVLGVESMALPGNVVRLAA